MHSETYQTVHIMHTANILQGIVICYSENTHPRTYYLLLRDAIIHAGV